MLLRLTRLGIIVLWILKLMLDPLWRLAWLPRELFHPIGILTLLPPRFLGHLMTPVGLALFLITTFIVLGLCLTNRAFPITSTVAAILLTAYASLMRSFGPAVHTDIVLLLAMYVLAGFAWADFLQYKFGREKTAPGAWCSYPLVTIVVLLCLSYTLVGFNRIFTGGTAIFNGNTMEVWAIDASLRGYYFNTNIGWHVPEWPFVAFMLKNGLPVVTLFEITAPLCLALPRYRFIFIPFMISFHLLSLVVMNIFFFDDMLLYLLLIDWSRRFPGLRMRQAPVDASSALPTP
jgi:hypothetical protein